MKNIIIDKIKIGQDQKVFVISEIGAMYEDIDGMKKLIKASKDAGADAVKIQTYRAETISLPGSEFEFEDGSRMSQYDYFKKYEISQKNHKILFDYASQIGIIIFSTPSYYDDVDFLDKLGVPAFKTGSDDLTNYPFLEYIAHKGKPVIVSTGMSNLEEVEKAVEVILKTGNDQLILLHCTVAYPPEPEYANLNIIKTLQMAFNLNIGFSDHIIGTFSSVLAASMGACIIEKHFTLDRSLEGPPDYQVSLEPAELKEMTDQIKLIPVLKGQFVKKVYSPEKKWRINGRKSLVAARSIKAGEKILKKDIKIIRPGNGVHPKYLDIFAGRLLKRDISKNELFSFDDILSQQIS